MAAGLPRPRITLAILIIVLCSALAVPGAITISRGQPRPSVVHHSPRPDHELEMQDAGGAPDGGVVESVVFTAGEFITRNGGVTWSPAFGGIRRASPTVFVGVRLFAGTMGRGVFESLDGGATWQPLP